MTEEKLHKTVSKRQDPKLKGRLNEIDVQRHTNHRKDDSEDKEVFDNEEVFDNAQPNVNAKIP